MSALQKNPCLCTCAALLCIVFAVACNNKQGDIPFPVKIGGFPQPSTVHLKFGPEKKLQWATVKNGGIHVVTKKMDIGSLPSTPYDTAGFKPLAQPVETSFNFAGLPSVPFNLGNLPSQPMHFKTMALPPPTTVKAGVIAPKIGAGGLSIFDVGQQQGLKGENVDCVLKDRNGLMWIATNAGIFRFDGEYMQAFVQRHISLAVVGMVEDPHGRIWAIQDEGIWMIDPKTGTESFSAESDIHNNTTAAILLDDKGRIWASFSGDRVSGNPGKIKIIDPDTQTFKQLDAKTGLSSNFIYNIIEDGNKNIWVSNLKGGIDIISTATGRIKFWDRTNGLVDTLLSAMATGKQGQVWLAGEGLYMVDVNKGVTKHFNTQFDNGYATNQLLVDGKGSVWMTNGQQIAMTDPQKPAMKQVRRDEGTDWGDAYSLQADYNQRIWVSSYKGLNIIEQNGEDVHPLGKTETSAMVEDGEGNIWMGSFDGIIMLDKKQKRARHIAIRDGLSSNDIQDLTENAGNIWVSTCAGIDIINPLDKTVGHITSDINVTNDTVYGTFKDSKANIWVIGTAGIDVISPNGKITRHAGLKEGLSDNNVTDIKQDSQGRIWLAANGGGVDVVDYENGTVKFLTEGLGLGDKCNKILMPDALGRMWIGTDNGIYIADTKNGLLTNITSTEGLPDDNITSLNVYKGVVIAATDSKIGIITPPANIDAANKGEFKIGLLANSDPLVKESDSWSTDCITSDGQYLWGDNTVTVINNIEEQNDYAPTYITGLNILGKPQYFVNSPVNRPNDTISQSDTVDIKGKINITVGYVGDVLQYDSVTGPYNLPVNLKIPYDQNVLQFQYAQAHLGRQGGALYCYMLQGIDKQWSEFTNKTVTDNYLNLPPGKYTFKVSSKGVGGKWGTSVAFTFTITPPWWQTWLAYCLYVLFAGVALWGYNRLRNKKLIKENKVLEDKVKQRTDELKKSLEDLQSTQKQLIQSEKMASLGELTSGIAHEIQNPLNFVNNFSDVSRELMEEMMEELDKGNIDEVKLLATDIEQNLKKINHHGKRADAIVKGMLEHSRKTSGKKELTNINALADEYFRLSYRALHGKDQSFNAVLHTDFDSTIGKISIIPGDISRVLLNLFNNAFYAVAERLKVEGEGYKAEVSVTTKKIDNKVEILVRDNGNGIPKKIIDKIFQPFFTTKPTGQGTGLGLSLSYDIIKAHGGEIRVETKEGEGTVFIVILPIS